ncbi:nickel-dependent hydrogenase large subunit [Telmatospirillum sp.]|uniref:hydrogenase large subunit n=1 Tax=Telmatospirillum sp. TaxID=2079197 RepID=UPI00283E4364|nr:nickel-dependent hydrogenase large subunit [Telmatospirillum sp.]MDR3440688.1 nickel-dependent hydrogenase large subunit [Telmatospirillum sp.]
MSTYKIPVGPLHVALEEPMFFKVEVEGETVVGLDITAGHAHRGIEYLVAKRNIHQNIVLTERICSLCSNSHPFSYCMALERIAGIVVPERVEYLRVVADEIKRIASHLFNVAITAHLVGFDSLFMHVMEIREIMQDTKESIFGNRMDLGANCIGGVRYDLDAEGRGYLLAQLDKLKAPLAEVRALYETNGSFLRRTKGVGVLPRAEAIRLGLVGPVARASGVDYDVRRKAPYVVYDKLSFDVQTLPDGDVWSRTMIRLREAIESIRIIEQCMRDMPEGPTTIDKTPEIPAGESIAKSEAPRGELIYYLRTDGSDKPERLKWRVPSYNNWKGLQVMLTGAKVADIALVVGSIDPCISCTER